MGGILPRTPRRVRWHRGFRRRSPPAPCVSRKNRERISPGREPPMNTAPAKVRPQVFRCGMEITIGRLPVAILATAALGLMLLPLTWHDGPLWPNRVLEWFMTLVRASVLPAIMMASGMFSRPGRILVFPDRVVVGLMASTETVARAAIISVERWNGPLFDLPWQATNARLHREGFAHNQTLGRFRYYLTDESNAVLIRRTGGTPLVVTPNDPDGFVEALGAAVGEAVTATTGGLV